jgi:hypothetical protein
MLLVCQGLNDFPAESSQIRGLPGGDEVAVVDYLGILILGASIDNIVLKGRKAGGAPSFQ